MTVKASTPRLPIRDLLNANPAWIRGEDSVLGDVLDLEASIESSGFKFPILIQPDFRVLDGARRVVAAKNLGWSDVPVLVIQDWDELHQQLVAVRKAETEGLPHVPLVRHKAEDVYVLERFVEAVEPIYSPTRIRNMVTNKAKSRSTGVRTHRGAGNSQFDEDLAKMLGLNPGRLGACRRIMSALKTCHVRKDGSGEKLDVAIRDFIENGGSIWALRDVAVELATGKESSIGPRYIRPVRRRDLNRAPEPDAREAREQLKSLSNLVGVLKDMGVMASEMSALNPAIELDDLIRLQEERKAALTRIGRLRTLLEHAITAKRASDT